MGLPDFRKVHLAHVVPHPRMHGLNGYKEVIETVGWGFAAIGCDVTYGLNQFSTEGVNIVFGAQMLPREFMEKLPPETIVYNFEQTKGFSPAEIRPETLEYARRFQIWDYSQANIEAWDAIGTARPPVHVPVGYAPILRRIKPPGQQDIDVLIYGMAAENRLRVFHELSARGLVTVFASGLYGPARDDLIGRAKVVLNVNMYRNCRIFEVVRVSYLLANSKAVVSDRDEDTVIEGDLIPAVTWSNLEGIADVCEALIADDKLRKRTENGGFEIMRKRDIREILKAALRAEGISINLNGAFEPQRRKDAEKIQ